jgi:hypothetical protein
VTNETFPEGPDAESSEPPRNRLRRSDRLASGLRPTRSLVRAFAVIGGMRASLVDEYEGERNYSIALFFILLATTVEAAIAGGFAISQAFTGSTGETQVPIWGIVTFALVWGAIIFAVDRFMVVGLEGIHGFRALIMMVFRGFLALVLGVVMATPLALAVFESDIQEEIRLIQGEEIGRLEGQLAVAQKDYDEKLAKTNGAQDALDAAIAGRDPDPESAPAVVGARDALATAQTSCDIAKDKAAKEENGQLPVSEGGSGKSGNGPQLRALRSAETAACSRVAGAQQTVNDAVVRASQVPENIEDLIAQRNDELRQANTHLDNADENVQHFSGIVENAQDDRSYGLLTSLAGLDRLIHGRPAADGLPAVEGNAQARAGHLWLSVFLVCLELMPVLFKGTKQALHGWRDPDYLTEYEKACKRQDTGAYDRLDQWETDATSAWTTESTLQRTNADGVRERQTELQDEMNDEIVLTQRLLMRQALREWRHEQAERLGISPAELSRELDGERERTDPASRGPRPETGGGTNE